MINQTGVDAMKNSPSDRGTRPGVITQDNVCELILDGSTPRRGDARLEFLCAPVGSLQPHSVEIHRVALI